MICIMRQAYDLTCVHRSHTPFARTGGYINSFIRQYNICPVGLIAGGDLCRTPSENTYIVFCCFRCYVTFARR